MSTVLFKRAASAYLKFNGALHQVSKEVAERLFKFDNFETWRDALTEAPQDPDGQVLSPIARLARPFGASTLFLIERDNIQRTWRWPLAPELARVMDYAKAEECRLAHLPIAPRLQVDKPALDDQQVKDYLSVNTDISSYTPAVGKVHYRDHGFREGRSYAPLVLETPEEPFLDRALDCTQNHVIIPEHAWFPGDFTIEAWVYPRTHQEARVIEFSLDSRLDCVLLAFSSAGRLRFEIYNGQDNRLDADKKGTLRLHTWSHVAVTFSSGTAVLYVAGQEVGRRTQMPIPAAGVRKKNYLGHNLWDAKPDALLAEVRVWSTARTVEDLRKRMYTRLQGSEPGLLGYWPLDEVSSRRVTDRADGARHGLLAGGGVPLDLAAGHPDIAASAVSLKGGAYLEAPEHTWFNGSALTIEAWVYPRAFKNWSRIIDFGNGSNSDNVVLVLSEGTTGCPALYVFQGAEKQNPPRLKAPSALPLNAWSHVAVTLSGTSATLYVNGEQVATETVRAPNAVGRSKNYIGKSNWATDEAPDMLISELRIWSVARTHAELRALMFSRLHGTEAGLVAWWPLDELQDEIPDHGPNRAVATARNNTRTRHQAGSLGGASRWQARWTGLDFNGTDSHLDAPPDVWFDGDFTIEAWVYPRAFKNWSRVIDFGNGPNSDNVVLVLSEGRSGFPALHVYRGAETQNPPSLKAPSALALNAWSHVAVTLSGTSARLYVNGQQVAAGTVKAPDAVRRSKNYIGKSNWASDEAADMLLSDLRIWSVAREEEQIKAGMNGLPSALEPGLRAWWRMNEPRKTDRGPNGLHVYAAQGATEATPLVTTKHLPLYERPVEADHAVLTLNGESDYVEVPPHPGFDVSRFTIEAWIKPGKIGVYDGIVTKGKETSPFALQLAPEGDGASHGRLRLGLNYGLPNGASVDSDARVVRRGVWQHVAVSYDQNTVRFYVNGDPAGERVCTSAVGRNTEPLIIGADFPGGDEFFKGAIGEVRLWNTVRTPAEIADTRNQRLRGTEVGLVGYWPLNDGTGAQAHTPVRATHALHRHEATGNISVHLDGHLRSVSSIEVLNRVFSSRSWLAYSGAAPLPEGPALDPDTMVVEVAGRRYLKDRMAPNLPLVWRPVSDAARDHFGFIEGVDARLLARVTGSTETITDFGPPVEIERCTLHGRLRGGTWQAAEGLDLTPAVEGALSLDGVSQYVEVPHHPQLNLERVTIQAWIYPRAFTEWAGIVTKGKTTTPFALQIGPPGSGAEAGRGRLRFSMNYGLPGQATRDSNLALSLNTWQHVAVSYDQQTVRFFVNGVACGEHALAGTLGQNTEALTLGADFPGGDEFFNGELCEVRVWSLALPEINTTWNRRVRGDEPGLVACWSLRASGGGEEVPDLGRSRLHGQLRGGRWVETGAVIQPAVREVRRIDGKQWGWASGSADPMPADNTPEKRDEIRLAGGAIQAAVEAAALVIPPVVLPGPAEVAQTADVVAAIADFNQLPEWMRRVFNLQGASATTVFGSPGKIGEEEVEAHEQITLNRRVRLGGTVTVLDRSATLKYGELFQKEGKKQASLRFELAQPMDLAELVPELIPGVSLRGVFALQQPLIYVTTTKVADFTGILRATGLTAEGNAPRDVESGVTVVGKFSPLSSTSEIVRSLGTVLGDNITLTAGLSDELVMLKAEIKSDLTIFGTDRSSVQLKFTKTKLVVQSKSVQKPGAKPTPELGAEAAISLKLILRGNTTQEVELIGGIKAAVKAGEVSATGSFTLKAGQAGWTNALGIPGLTIRSLAVQLGMALVPKPGPKSIGMHGDMTIGDINGSLSILIDTSNADNFVFVARTPRLTILQAMVMSPLTLAAYLAVPSGIRTALNRVFDVAVEDVLISIVPKATKIGEIRFDEEGVIIKGALSLWGWKTRLFIHLDSVNSKGVAGSQAVTVEGSIDPLVLKAGPLTLLSIHGATGADQPLELKAKLAVGDMPNLYISGAVSLLGIEASLLARVDEAGLVFKVEGSVAGILTSRIEVTLNDRGFRAAGSIDFNLNLVIPVPVVGDLTLVDIGFNAAAAIEFATHPAKFKLELSGGFRFYGASITFPKLTLEVAPDGPLALLQSVGQQLIDNAEDLFKSLFKGIFELAQAVAAGLVKLADTIAAIATKVFDETMQAAAEAYKFLDRAATDAARELEGAFQLGTQAVTEALLFAEYGAKEVEGALTQAFAVPAAEAGKIVNQAAEAVVGAANAVGNGIEAAAKDVASGFQEVGRSVTGLLEEIF